MTKSVMNGTPGLLDAVTHNNPKSTKPKKHDRIIQQTIGGILMDKKDMLVIIERLYLANTKRRGGKKPDVTARRIYNWWLKRGVITEIN